MSRPGNMTFRSPVAMATHKPCDRADMMAWSQQGGPLPTSLANHIATCSACAERVRRVNQVHAGLMLLRTDRVPTHTRARANAKSLRMLRRAARASKAAYRLLRMRPNLTPWQRAQVHIARVSLASAAAVLLLVARIGVFSGFERTRQLGQQLADAHWQRHIDPNGEFLGPHDVL